MNAVNEELRRQTDELTERIARCQEELGVFKVSHLIYMCMYVCMYVCIYDYVCVCMCMYVYVCVCMCMYVYVYVYMHVCIYMYIINILIHTTYTILDIF
jgi:ABC-type transport system involved in Fe-S cluster assembly fused permease/ATPase subunit